MNKIIALILSSFIGCSAESQSLLPPPGADEIILGPVDQVVTTNGLTLNLPTAAYINIATSQQQMTIRVRAIVDLADIFAKFGSIVDSIDLPRDNCKNFGADNIVASIWGKRVKIDGNVLVIQLNGDVDNWTCVKNPVPCTRVDWVVKDGPLGSKLSLPEAVVYECNDPIKNRNVNQPFDATITVGLTVDGQSVKVEFKDGSLALGGSLGSFTEGVLHIAGIDMSTKMRSMLAEAFGAEQFRKALPTDLSSSGFSIESARFFEEKGGNFAELALTGRVAPERLTPLLRVLAEPKSVE